MNDGIDVREPTRICVHDQLPSLPLLPVSFYTRDAREVARQLLGKWLVRRSRHGMCVVKIVETEAYLAEGDPACHAARGKTPRNEAMFGPPGRSYVYAIHSRWCFNIVCQAEGEPAAVLIRAAEPVSGDAVMERLRGGCRRLDWLRGPSRLCEALAIDKRLNHWPLYRPQRLYVVASPDPGLDVEEIGVSPRIGVTSAHDLRLRYFVDGSPYVSGPRKWHARPIERPAVRPH